MTRVPLAAAGVLLAVAALAGPGAAPAQTPVAAVATTPLRILPLGDSITYGRWSETTSSYRIDLQRRLRAAGLTVDFVGSQRSGSPATADLDNEGHPGWRIDQLAAQVDGWLAAYRPDVVLLLAGTNDMNQDHRTATAPDRLAALVDRIHAQRPAAHVFLQQLPSSTRPAVAARIAAFNAAIPAIAAERASYVHVVDQSGIGGVLLGDALHPHDHGFALMSWNLYRAMEPVLRGAGAPWPAGANPHLATSARMCTVTTTRDARGIRRYRWDCATWHRRPLTTVRDGQPVTEDVWQRQRRVTQWYRVWVPGHHVTVLRDGRKVRVYVAGHYEQRTRTVLRWVTA